MNGARYRRLRAATSICRRAAEVIEAKWASIHGIALIILLPILKEHNIEKLSNNRVLLEFLHHLSDKFHLAVLTFKFIIVALTNASADTALHHGVTFHDLVGGITAA